MAVDLDANSLEIQTTKTDLENFAATAADRITALELEIQEVSNSFEAHLLALGSQLEIYKELLSRTNAALALFG